MLEALPKIPDLVEAAKKDGQTVLALTDNGNMYGSIEFYKECKQQGLKPIIGVDFFVAPRTRNDREHKVDDQLGRLVLLAKNDTGYHNLIRLVSASYLEGFYVRPRIDRELIEKYPTARRDTRMPASRHMRFATPNPTGIAGTGVVQKLFAPIVM